MFCWICGRENDLECPPLCSGHNQRKIILKFGISERLRAFRYSIFTAGVVKESSICSAASCGSAALREGYLFSAGQKANADCLYNPPREKAIRENPRMRSNKSPSGAFKRQSGLRTQMEGLCLNKLRRFFRIANYNKIPLKMPRAQRRRPPPAAEAGRSCWGSGQQDASAAQGTKRMLGAATR